MTEVRDFVAALARAGKSRKEIKPLVDAAYGDKSLSSSQINRIILAVKAGKNTSWRHRCCRCLFGRKQAFHCSWTCHQTWPNCLGCLQNSNCRFGPCEEIGAVGPQTSVTSPEGGASSDGQTPWPHGRPSDTDNISTTGRNFRNIVLWIPIRNCLYQKFIYVSILKPRR